MIISEQADGFIHLYSDLGVKIHGGTPEADYDDVILREGEDTSGYTETAIPRESALADMARGLQQRIDNLGTMLSREPDILTRLSVLEAKMADIYGHDQSDDILVKFIEKPDITHEELYVRNIPESVRRAVTHVGNCVFQKFERLQSAVFPNATSIGLQSFNGCEVMTEASFPEVTSMGEKAFGDCVELVSANFPKLHIIPVNAFLNNAALTTINFPVAITISNNAFKGCSSLGSILFPEVTTIAESAFNGCTALTAVSFPKVTDIGISAFQGSVELTDLDFPEALTIRGNAFKGCVDLVDVEFPKVTSVLANAFENCTALKTVKLPKAETFNAAIFQSCTALESVEAPLVSTVPDSCFADRSTLQSVDFESATSFIQRSFENCSHLTTLNLPENASISVGLRAFKNCPNLEFPKGLTVNLTDNTNRYAYANGNATFAECKKLEEITITNSYIPSWSFYYCTNLKKFSAPHATTLYYRAFMGCSSLEKINLPELTHIKASESGYQAPWTEPFYNSGVKKIMMPKLSTIENSNSGVFQTCPELETIYFPNLIVIGQDYNTHTFANNPKLKWCCLPEYQGVSTTNHHAIESMFRYCPELEYLWMPGITYSYDYAFIGCKKIKLLGTPNLDKYSYEWTSAGDGYRAPFSKNESGNIPQVQYVDYRTRTTVITLSTNSGSGKQAQNIFPGYYDEEGTFHNTKYIVPDDLYEDWIVNTSFVNCVDDVVKQSDFEADPDHPEYPWVVDPTLLEHYFDDEEEEEENEEQVNEP